MCARSARAPLGVALAVLLALPLAVRGQAEEKRPEKLKPLPAPPPGKGVRFFTMRSRGAVCGMSIHEQARLVGNPYAQNDLSVVSQEIHYSRLAEERLGVPVDTTALQILYRVPQSNEILGFAVAQRQTLAPRAELEGADWDPLDQLTQAVVAPQQDGLQLKVVVYRDGEEYRRLSLPLKADERLAPDARFVHREFVSRELGPGRETRFRFVAVESLARVVADVRRLPDDRLRLADDRIHDVAVYEVVTRPAEAKTGKGKPHRLYFRLSDGELVRSERGRDESWVTEWSDDPLAPQSLQRLALEVDRLKPRLPFPPGEFLDYRLRAGRRELARLSVRFSRRRSSQGETLLEAWNSLALRTGDGAGRDEETTTLYGEGYLPVLSETEGVLRIPEESEQENNQEQPPTTGQPPEMRNWHEVPGELEEYVRRVERDGRFLKGMLANSTARRTRKVVAEGPVYFIDANAASAWILVAGGLELHEGKRYKIGVFVPRQLKLGIMGLQVETPKRSADGKRAVYPVSFNAPSLDLFGRLFVSDDGRLLSLQRVYPDGKRVELRLVSR